jgi:hypothetical protein
LENFFKHKNIKWKSNYWHSFFTNVRS